MRGRSVPPRWLIAGRAAALVGIVGLVGCSQNASEVIFTTLHGEERRLADWHGSPVLVTFWASDCRTCLLEIPELDRLQREHAPRGFKVLAVAMAYDNPSRVLALANSANLSYAVALDASGKIAQAFGGVQLVPTTFLITADGTIALRHLGKLDFQTLNQELRRLLGES